MGHTLRTLSRWLLASSLLAGCSLQMHVTYVTTDGVTIARDVPFSDTSVRIESARRSAAHDLHCPIDSMQTQVIQGRPVQVVVDGCGERIVYAEQFDYASEIHTFVATSRFRP